MEFVQVIWKRPDSDSSLHRGASGCLVQRARPAVRKPIDKNACEMNVPAEISSDFWNLKQSPRRLWPAHRSFSGLPFLAHGEPVPFGSALSPKGLSVAFFGHIGQAAASFRFSM
jgi:hypothetical protein